MVTTSFRTDDQLMEKVDALAVTLDRPKGWVIEQALRRYVETEGWQIQAIQEAVDDVRSGTAVFVPHEDVMACIEAKMKGHGLLK